jgi:hypothetical protein
MTDEDETGVGGLIRQREDDEAARLAATASVEQAEAAIAWLRALLELQLGNARDRGDEFRIAELGGLLVILDRHEPEDVEAWDRRVWHCRAKCSSESWRCYTDGQEVVASPCATVLALARPYAAAPDFPEVLCEPDA